MSNKQIGIAMSGGVDSTASAIMLKENNTIQGFFMRLAQPDFDSQLAKVEKITNQLAISLHVIDLREAFTQHVLTYFSDSYFEGKTPNPCMICNHEIKFGLFQHAIMQHGVDMMATGHYARITQDEYGYHLLDGLDSTKNQSYFLSRLTQQQLARTVFPLGRMHKSDIFAFVKERGFDHFEGEESQDICFLGNETVGNYLESKHPEAVHHGPIISTSGERVGEHSGLFRYTIGQRRGLGIPDATPWYVAGIDAKRNTLIVGKPDDLMKKTIELANVHWISGCPPALDQPYKVRIRYSHRGSMATISLHGDSSATLLFNEEQRAITPGQFAVIYHDNEVLGSGVIK